MNTDDEIIRLVMDKRRIILNVFKDVIGAYKLQFFQESEDSFRLKNQFVTFLIDDHPNDFLFQVKENESGDIFDMCVLYRFFYTTTKHIELSEKTQSENDSFKKSLLYCVALINNGLDNVVRGDFSWKEKYRGFASIFRDCSYNIMSNYGKDDPIYKKYIGGDYSFLEDLGLYSWGK